MLVGVGEASFVALASPFIGKQLDTTATAVETVQKECKAVMAASDSIAACRLNEHLAAG